MSVNRLFGAIALAGLITVGSAMAAGPYDGQWSARSNYNNTHCPGGDFPVTVADNRVTGVYKGMHGSYDLSGAIAADGSFSGSFGRGHLSGKFSGDKGEASFPPPEAVCGEGHMQFERAK
ncbi:MAG TPA: hypothetical protein VL244_05480 [Alphaproteobacteria bacterium]|nr:hypothetical protein [Alphaproteobacteria bacterium]